MKKLITLLCLAGGLSANAQVCFAPDTVFATGTAPSSVASADFDSDGYPDLVVANWTTNNVSVLMGTGTGTFSSAAVFTTGVHPACVTIADFDGDGMDDLAVANNGSNNVSIRLGIGGGSFGPATTFAVGTAPTSVTSADFDGDGLPDLAVTNWTTDNVSILIGTGSGSFSPAFNYIVSTNPTSVKSADFNGDGHPDLAVANKTFNNISVLLGTGTGTFGSATPYSLGAGAGSTSVIIADFNGDTHADLAVANSFSDNVSVLLGTGTGTFATGAVFATGTGPTSVTSADFNQDGIADLAVTNGTSNNVSVLIGTGTGSFAVATNFATGTNPYSVVSGDYNGDAHADLAVVNNSSNNVSILLNAVLPTVSAGPDQSVCAGTSVTLSGSNATSYAWNNGITNGVPFVPVTSNTYIVTGTNTNGCTITDTVVVTIKTIFQNEIICEVNVDTSIGKNLIIWEKTPNVGTKAFVIYKEGIVGGVYNPVDTIPYDSMSIYRDMSSNAMAKSDRYKISVLDSCGSESALSAAHKTLHLTINLGMGGAINLIWENYEGFAFGSYIIYRGPTTHTLLPIDTIPNTIMTYTDVPPPGINYYLIVIVKTDSCIASSSAKDQTETYNTTVSNMEEYQILGVEQNQNNINGFEIYPNPSKDKIQVRSERFEVRSIEIYNLQGMLLKSFTINDRAATIDISSLASGMYIVKAKTEDGILVKKFVKE